MNTEFLFLLISAQGSPQHTSSPGANNGYSSQDGSAEGAAVEDTQSVAMCIVMGGMDTEGEIFDDTLVMLLDES